MPESVNPSEIDLNKDADEEIKTVERLETHHYQRFRYYQRIEHWLFMGSFTLLAITGLVQKFASTNLSQGSFSVGSGIYGIADNIIHLLGGIETVRLIHHIAATVMMIVTIYHIGAVIYRLYVKRSRMSMLPGLNDVVAAIGSFLYNLGARKNRPQEGRYTFGEKVEYWAVVWGTIVMAVTGFLMWNPITSTRLLSGEIIPAAKLAHGAEAILAVLSILLWHLYHVIIRTFNRSMYNGYLTEEQMLEEHPIELADIKSGLAVRPVDPVVLKRRKRIFFPIYAVCAALLLAGVYFFVGYEETAIATVPPLEATVEVFVPFTPTPFPTPLPTPTPVPIQTVTWDGGIGTLFESKCGGCHNSTGKIGGLDLTSYQSALAGGNSGPAIVPGDAEASMVVKVQSAGNHPGQFTPEELELIVEWIDAGALEK